MASLLTPAFEAHHAERDHHRHYEVRIGRDLLDDWTVTKRYGPTGQHGQERRYGSPKPEACGRSSATGCGGACPLRGGPAASTGSQRSPRPAV
jgi:hypothetical protein